MPALRIHPDYRPSLPAALPAFGLVMLVLAAWLVALGVWG